MEVLFRGEVGDFGQIADSPADPNLVGFEQGLDAATQESQEHPVIGDPWTEGVGDASAGVEQGSLCPRPEHSLRLRREMRSVVSFTLVLVPFPLGGREDQ